MGISSTSAFTSSTPALLTRTSSLPEALDCRFHTHAGLRSDRDVRSKGGGHAAVVTDGCRDVLDQIVRKTVYDHLRTVTRELKASRFAVPPPVTIATLSFSFWSILTLLLAAPTILLWLQA
jgi:hypothetical protein